MRYNVVTQERKLRLSDFLESCYFPELTQMGCEGCFNYNKRHCCPPFGFTPLEFFGAFDSITLIAKIISFAPSVTSDEALEIVSRINREITAQLVCSERAGERATSAGFCALCDLCEREFGRGCSKPEKMRYSLEALGIDLSKASELYFGRKLLWIEKKPPQYVMQIFSMLSLEKK